MSEVFARESLTRIMEITADMYRTFAIAVCRKAVVEGFSVVAKDRFSRKDLETRMLWEIFPKPQNQG